MFFLFDGINVTGPYSFSELLLIKTKSKKRFWVYSVFEKKWEILDSSYICKIKTKGYDKKIKNIDWIPSPPNISIYFKN